MNFNFRQWLESSNKQYPTNRQVALVAIGAYNPVHRGHLRAAYHAKRFLQVKEDCDVLAAYMVPKHQKYVDEKAKQKGESPVPVENRVQALQLALRGSFIKPLLIDIEYGPMTDQQIKAEVQNMHPNLEVVMVVGDDYVHCPNNQAPPCFMDVPGYGMEYIAPRGQDNYSSTAVRAALKQGEQTPMLAPQVLNYIKGKHLWGA